MSTSPLRLLFAGIALLAIGAQLAWEALHGGISWLLDRCVRWAMHLVRPA